LTEYYADPENFRTHPNGDTSVDIPRRSGGSKAKGLKEKHQPNWNF